MGLQFLRPQLPYCGGAFGLKHYQQWFTTEQEVDLTCLVCGQDGEDKTNFVFHCKAYTNLRKKYNIFDSATTHCSMKLVHALLASKNETEILALAKYITEAMKITKKKVKDN